MLRITTTVSLALLVALVVPAPAQVANSKLGQNVDGHVFIPEAFETVEQSGAKWVRLSAFWKVMQPSPTGPINWSWLDADVFEADERNLDVLITFASVPNWSNNSPLNCDFWSAECSDPPTSPQHFKDFARAVASRYATRVHHWEIWNEPDLNIFWNGTQQQWHDLILVPGVQGIREVAPTARILGPATWASFGTFSGWSWLACDHLDALSTHFYRGSSSAMFEAVDQEFAPWIADYCNKPLWITEAGIDSWDVGEKQQGLELRDAYAGAVARGNIETLFIYRWYDGGGKGWGLSELPGRDYREKRSFFDIQDFTLALRGMRNSTSIRDSFSLDDGRNIGATVHGTITEIGGRTWAASSGIVFGTSELTTAGGSLQHFASVPFAPPAGQSGARFFVRSDVNPAGAEWIAIGFSSAPASPFWSGGEVWSHLGPDGAFGVYCNGLSKYLGGGTAPSFVAGHLNRFELAHETLSNEVVVQVNDSELLRANLSPCTSSRAFASIQIQSLPSAPTGVLSIDSFIVGVDVPNWILADGFESGGLQAWSTQQ